jgi:hypothetical protein
MVSVMDAGYMHVYPHLQKYFKKQPQVVHGVGGCECTVLGQLQQVPISLGTA